MIQSIINGFKLKDIKLILKIQGKMAEIFLNLIIEKDRLKTVICTYKLNLQLYQFFFFPNLQHFTIIKFFNFLFNKNINNLKYIQIRSIKYKYPKKQLDLQFYFIFFFKQRIILTSFFIFPSLQDLSYYYLLLLSYFHIPLINFYYKYLQYTFINQTSNMAWLHSIMWGFSISYTIYWFISMFDQQKTNFGFQLVLDTIGRIIALAYLCYNLLVVAIVIFYVLYLKVLWQMSKLEIQQKIIMNNKKKILVYCFLNLIFALIIFIFLLQQNDSFNQADFVKIHALVLAVIQYIQFYSVSKQYEFFKTLFKEIIYFITLVLLIGLIIFMDVFYSDFRGYKHELSGSVIILLQLICLQFFISRQKLNLGKTLKIFEYAYLVRYYYLFVTGFANFINIDRSKSIDFILMIFSFILLDILILKDIIILFVYLNRKYQKYQQLQKRTQRKIKLVNYFRNLKSRRIDMSSGLILNSQKCIICLDQNKQDSISLNCKHCFHIECISQWLAHRQTCPLCIMSVEI